MQARREIDLDLPSGDQRETGVCEMICRADTRDLGHWHCDLAHGDSKEMDQESVRSLRPLPSAVLPGCRLPREDTASQWNRHLHLHLSGSTCLPSAWRSRW